MQPPTALHPLLAVANDGSCFLAVLHNAIEAELQVGKVSLQCQCPLTPAYHTIHNHFVRGLLVCKCEVLSTRSRFKDALTWQVLLLVCIMSGVLSACSQECSDLQNACIIEKVPAMQYAVNEIQYSVRDSVWDSVCSV